MPVKLPAGAVRDPTTGEAPTYRRFYDLRLLPAAVWGWLVTWIVTGSDPRGYLPAWVGIYVIAAIIVAALMLLSCGAPPPPKHARYPVGKLRAVGAAILMLSAISATSALVAAQLYHLDQSQLSCPGQCVITGNVTKPSVDNGHGWNAQIQVKHVHSQGALVQIRSRDRILAHWGQCVQVRGALWAGEGVPIWGYIRTDQVTVLPDKACGSPAFVTAVSRFRERWKAASADQPPAVRGLIQGMSVGDTSDLPAQYRQMLRAASLSHLTAISGAHLAVVVSAVHLLIPGRSRGKAILLIAVMIVIALLSGLSASALRAASMGIALLISIQNGRRSRAEANLTLVILGWLIVDPWLARDWGFALSCAATVGVLAAVQNQPQSSISERHGGWRKRLGSVVSISLYAQLATAPLVMAMTGKFPLWAVVANVLVTPMVAFATLTSIAAACLAQISLPASQWLIHLAAYPAQLILKIAAWVSELPYALVPAPVGMTFTAVAVIVLVAVKNWKALRRRLTPPAWKGGTDNRREGVWVR